jgi:hypothetical protein
VCFSLTDLEKGGISLWCGYMRGVRALIRAEQDKCAKRCMALYQYIYRLK